MCDEHVYQDDAVSGAQCAKRPGLARLLNALGKRAPFDVLVVSELSRLGREQLETGDVVKRLSQAGVAVWSDLERKEILMSSPTDEFLMSAMSFAAEVEREKARERSQDASRQRAAEPTATPTSATRPDSWCARSCRRKPTSWGESFGCARRARARGEAR